MNPTTSEETLADEAEKLLAAEHASVARRTDRMFALLLLAQWAVGVLLAFYLSPYTWAGGTRSVHSHVYAAFFLGGAITVFPVGLAYFRSGKQSTRYVLACAQALWSGLLIHLTGGRIETHFHIFGSLAFMAFYRDLKVLIPATIVVAGDHFLRGVFWPESIYGVANPDWWRFIEHAGWVVFIDVFLIRNCQRSYSDLQRLCRRQAELSASESAIRRASEDLERTVATRTVELSDMVLALEAANTAIEAKQKQAFQFLEGIPLGVYVTNDASELVYANETARRLLGDAQLNAKATPFNACAAEDIPKLDNAWLSAFAGRPTVVEHVEAKGCEGTFPAFLKVVPIHGVGNAVDFALTAFEDVSEMKRLEAERLQSQKLESVGQLAAGIAHEINTPMQYIGSNAHFLQKAIGKLIKLVESYDALLPDDARARADKTAKAMKYAYLQKKAPQAANAAIEGVETVSQLVRAMKEFSHPGGDEKTPVDINRAIETTLTVSKNEWKYAADVETDFDPSLPLVPCLPGELNQVVLNMIVNASHAIADKHGSDHAKGKIEVRTRQSGPYAEIEIRDDGNGIPDSVRQKIFDPFFTTKEVGKGTGQGLAIARSIIVDKHGGAIRVDSQAGEGTTFTIQLPLNAEANLQGAA